MQPLPLSVHGLIALRRCTGAACIFGCCTQVTEVGGGAIAPSFSVVHGVTNWHVQQYLSNKTVPLERIGKVWLAGQVA